VPYLRRIQQEHDAFVDALRREDVNVYYLRDVLADVLADANVRAELIAEVCAAPLVPAVADELAAGDHWSRDELIDVLFAGLTAREFEQRTARRVAAPGTDAHFLLSPIPNAYFTRDPAVVVRDAAVSCKMHHRERVRETLLIRAALEHHPTWRDNIITYGGSGEPTEDRPYTIEGGDVIILSPQAVLVGASARTRSETIELLAEKCFHFGHVQRVYEVPIPAERAFMHLDTVITVIDRGMVLWYSKVMQQVAYVHRYEALEQDGQVRARRMPEKRSLPDILRDEFRTDLTIIDTAGGNELFASREQRNDAANALAVAPRTVITYERNERTIAALEAHGVRCIGIDDSELVRGLGGPRCMTMPLRRAQP
jgi:arginine deiminase